MRLSINITIAALIVLSAVSTVVAVPGDTLKSINAPFTCSQGMTYDGDNLWVADRRSDVIYRVSPEDGSSDYQIPTPGYVPRGLTYDGELLWIVDADAQLIYAINPESKIAEKTIWCPVANPGGLAWDGEFLWISDDGANKLRQLSTEDGTEIVSIPAPNSHPGGLCYDGKYLWVADRYANMIYMVLPSTGDVIIAFETPGPHAAGLAWDGENIWNVDYETDLVYKLIVDDDTPFVRSDERELEVEFIHQTRNFGPGELVSLNVFLAKPANRDNQEIVGEVTFTPEPSKSISEGIDQQIMQFDFESVNALDFTEVTMKARAKLYKTRYYIFPEKVGSLDDIPDDVRELYLENDSKFSYESSIIQNALDRSVGDETNPYWIARKIYNYVIDHVEYELAGGWNIAPTVLDRGTGSCSEYTFVYIAMCRAAGVPARYVGSIVTRGDNASWDDVFHRWVEVYLPNFGWIPVDPSGGDSPWPAHRANYFGFLDHRFLITTESAGGSEYLGWGYNANEKWQSKGRVKVDVENVGEWTPVD